MSVIISNEEDKKKIKAALEEISNAKVQIEGHKAFIKTVVDDLHENFKDKLTRKQINKMAKVFHAGNFKTEVQQHEEFEILYETITGEKSE